MKHNLISKEHLQRILIVLGISTVLINYGCRNNKENKANTADYFISTESESNQRVKALGLDKPSEDASSILDTTKLNIPRTKHSQLINDNSKRLKADKQFDKEAIILLKSDSAWKGVVVWDVLQSVGLRWGDGDLFHWVNYNHNYGDDQLFSVWTTTEPGYFLPEQIKKGQMDPHNLIFGFSIPRNADPENVFAIMVQAVKYCQKRLGGEILDENQEPFNEAKAEGNLKSLVIKMKSEGIIPGSDKALMAY